MPRDAEVEGVFDDILAAPERWVEVHPLPAPHRLALRRNFLEEVNDPLVRLQLSESLAQPKNFGPFEVILRNQPGLLDRWLRFRTEALTPIAHAWLSAIGVEAIEKSGGRSAS